MNAIRCPHCGVVNLNKFVTYPYCAGCGSRLPAPPRVPLWRRPLGPQVWAFLLCGSALSLLAAVALLATPEPELGRLTIPESSSLSMKVGETVPLQVMIGQSSIEGVPPELILNDLTLRISRKTLTNLDIVTLDPPPTQHAEEYDAHYYSYRSFSRSKPLVFMLRLRKAVNVPFSVVFSARGQTSTSFHADVGVLPQTNVRVMPQAGKIPPISTARQSY